MGRKTQPVPVDTKLDRVVSGCFGCIGMVLAIGFLVGIVSMLIGKMW